MPSIFSRIIAGEIPCYKIAEDDRFIAFLDVNPVAPGHTLVVPKHEVSYLFDLSDEEYTGLELFAKKVALGLRQAVPCKADMDFHNKKTLPGEEMERLQKIISAAVAAHM